MKTTILPFQDALGLATSCTTKKTHLLMGNGFSIACKPNIFQYGSLFEKANFDDLSPHAKDAFAALGTTDFEVVMQALRNAAALIDLYAGAGKKLSRQLVEDAEGLREVLVQTIAHHHPGGPSNVTDEQFAACRNFLSNFDRLYTLNYDLLLYWTLMHDESEIELEADDGFRAAEDPDEDYVTWEVENTHHQKVFYLHGALHLFDAGHELKKYTWSRTGVRLIEQIRTALKDNLYPLIVAEGESEGKVRRIGHCGYLHRGLRSFKEISGSLFLFGHSLADNDQHITKSINKNRKLERLFVSIFGDPSTPDNKYIIQRANALAINQDRKKPLDVVFYDAASAKVWG